MLALTNSQRRVTVKRDYAHTFADSQRLDHKPHSINDQPRHSPPSYTALPPRAYPPAALSHDELAPYTFPRSREPRTMKMSELPGCSGYWEERDRRGSDGSLLSDASEDGPQPAWWGVPWLAFQPPPYASEACVPQVHDATADDRWYRDLVDKLARGESVDGVDAAMSAIDAPLDVGKTESSASGKV